MMDTAISSCFRLIPGVWVVQVAFPLRSENAVVSMETKALEGLGAAFLPVPPTHTVNWVLLLGAGAGVSCSVHQRVQAIVPSDILQPCPASEPGILRGALRRS